VCVCACAHACPCVCVQYERTKFPSPFLSSLLLLFVSVSGVYQLTDVQKQFFLDQHNRARSMVDPIATNMEEMVSRQAQ